MPPQRVRRPYRAWRSVHDGSKVKVRVDKRDWIYNIEITPTGVTEDNRNAKTPICGSLHRWTSIVLYYNLMSSLVRVGRYRYIDVLHTNKGDILQTSSEISGKLPSDYHKRIGNILAAMLPAGSITGAPKDKTVQIIHEAEGYDRGFYTGIMGIYDNGMLNSAVMIRFMEKDEKGIFFKAGGGITSKSDCRKEFEEVLQKVYLPFE